MATTTARPARPKTTRKPKEHAAEMAALAASEKLAYAAEDAKTKPVTKPVTKKPAPKVATPVPAPKTTSPGKGLTGKAYTQALVDAALANGEPDLVKIAPNKLGAAVVAARGRGHRWTVIAVLAGKSVSAVQRAFEETTGENYRTSYAGTGRDFRK